MKLEPGTRDARNLYRTAENGNMCSRRGDNLPPKLARFDYCNRTTYSTQHRKLLSSPVLPNSPKLVNW